MGRVKKYKKVKAMDPFAKGGGGGKMGRKSRSDDLDRNLPPEVKNHQAQRLNNLEGGMLHTSHTYGELLCFWVFSIVFRTVCVAVWCVVSCCVPYREKSWY